MKGQIPWNKGLTKETDSRIKVTSGFEGHHHTQASKELMRETCEGYTSWNKGLTKETDARVIKMGWSKGLTKEIDSRIMQMALAHNGQIPWNKGLTKDTNDSLRQAIPRQSQIQKELWQDSEHAKKCLHRRTPSGEEIKLAKLLIDNNFEYKYVGNGEVWFGGKNPDFMNTNGQKKLIELWGNYFHKGQNPQDRIDHFKKYGFETLVIWASEMRHSELVINRIRVFECR